jgi:hypothetical protein
MVPGPSDDSPSSSAGDRPSDAKADLPQAARVPSARAPWPHERAHPSAGPTGFGARPFLAVSDRVARPSPSRPTPPRITRSAEPGAQADRTGQRWQTARACSICARDTRPHREVRRVPGPGYGSPPTRARSCSLVLADRRMRSRAGRLRGAHGTVRPPEDQPNVGSSIGFGHPADLLFGGSVRASAGHSPAEPQVRADRPVLGGSEPVAEPSHCRDLLDRFAYGWAGAGRSAMSISSPRGRG